MESMEIARRLLEQFPEDVIDSYEFHGQVGVLVQRQRIVTILSWLHDSPNLQMNHLMALCGVDNKKRMTESLQRFEVVYNLYSIPLRHGIRLRAQIPEDDPVIDSVTGIWAGADWLERECYDLMGISFSGHNNLRRILLPVDWSGHPLQKEYPLKGREEWSGLEDLLHKVEKLNPLGFQEKQNMHEATPKNRQQGNTTA